MKTVENLENLERENARLRERLEKSDTAIEKTIRWIDYLQNMTINTPENIWGEGRDNAE